MTSALLAQGTGGFGGRRANASSTPPTPAQLAARQLQVVAHFLSLDSAQTSALTGNTNLVGSLTTEETTLQTNAATLKTDQTTLATQLLAAPLSTPAELTAIDTLLNSNLQLRVAAAGQIVSALQGLTGNLALSAAQTAKLPNLIGLLAGGGGYGFHGPRH